MPSPSLSRLRGNGLIGKGLRKEAGCIFSLFFASSFAASFLREKNAYLPNGTNHVRSLSFLFIGIEAEAFGAAPASS